MRGAMFQKADAPWGKPVRSEAAESPAQETPAETPEG